MSVVRRTSVIAVSAALLALAGCGGEDGKRSASGDASPESSATTTVTGTPSGTATSPGAEDTATSSATSDPTTSSGGDCATSKGIPDGTWEGPLTMDVRGAGGGSGYADSKGRGSFRVVVANGKVTGGTWTIAWKSEGSADTGEAAANIKLDGTVTGIVKGTATRPVLPGTWKIDGVVTVTKPQKYTAPISETGEDTETMKILAADCDGVTGTFIPSFNSKETAATFTGKAEWKGVPAG